MKFVYAHDASTNSYYASGDNELGYISESADSLAELMEKVDLCIEMLYEEKAEEFNKLQESNGSFTRYQLPKAIYEKVELNDYFAD
jgi:hypothetical protein